MKILIIGTTEQSASNAAANIFINQVRTSPTSIIGLATGSSPIKVYQAMIDDYKKNKTSWAKIKTVNLDEYIGLDGKHSQSYRFFMNDKLFSKVDIDIKNTMIPNGIGDASKNAASYEKQVAKLGYVDLQLLGIGINGHIAFNEPGSSFSSPTRVEALTKSTITANSRMFTNPSEVPKQAITMGIGTILKAKKLVLIAFGQSKAQAISNLLTIKPNEKHPSTALNLHSSVVVVIDKEAASETDLIKAKKNGWVITKLLD